MLNAQDADVVCWGESISLNLKSNEAADAGIIREFVSRVAVSLPPLREKKTAEVHR